MKAKLSVLGVRGSFPVADRQFMEYGGNTSCISLEQGHGEDVLCFDAGSGLYSLCGRLNGVKRLHILISHVHIDHILGLISLSALQVPEIHLYGGDMGEVGKGGFQKQLETVIGRPSWPVALGGMGRIHFHEICGSGPFRLAGAGGAAGIRTLHGNHPGGSLLYRAELGEVSVTYALDCEMDDAMFSGLAEFAAGSSLLVWDANFVQADKRLGWGHSTWEEGLALGRAAGAERVLMTHYSREYSDVFLQEQELAAKEQDSACLFAREGMVIEL